jgi:hypothetical protein
VDTGFPTRTCAKRKSKREQELQALMAKQPHRGSRALRRAAAVLLLPACLALCAGLSGCAGLAAGNSEMQLAGPDPSFRDAVANHLKKVLKNYALYDSFEISDPRWVHSVKGWTWLTCVRFREQGRVRNYALFLDGNQIVDDRFAVQTDNCDLQTFYPFERMPTGLAPLH